VAKFRLFLYTRLFDAIVAILVFMSAAMSFTRYFFYITRVSEYVLLKGSLDLAAGALLVCRLIDLTVPLHRRFEKELFREDEDQRGNHPGSR